MASRSWCAFLTPLWLLRKLQLQASDWNADPRCTYILADAPECTFQLSFQEAHISLPVWSHSIPLSFHAGRGCDWQTVDGGSQRLENGSICCVIRNAGTRGSTGCGDPCVTDSNSISCKSDCLTSVEVLKWVWPQRQEILVRLTSVWDYCFKLQSDAQKLKLPRRRSKVL